MNLIDRMERSRLGWVTLLIALIGVNVLGSILHLRFDLTREKRYTLSRATRTAIRQLNGPLEVDVFLKGEFPSGFRKLANTTREFLSLLRDQNNGQVRYRFISPEEPVPGARVSWGDSLVRLGAVPINLTVQKKAGESSNILFPTALVKYNGRQSLVNLYPGASGQISQDEINQAEALLEYQFLQAVDRLTRDRLPGIAYATGHGEPTDGRTYDLTQALQEGYRFGTLDLAQAALIPKEVDLLLLVKPTQGFTEEEKLKIDQFVMRGGRLLCFIDNLIAEQDSLALKSETIAFDRNLNLTDLFFRYGLRINTDLVMDLQCDAIPFVVGGTADNPQLEFLRWNYYPVLNAVSGRITRRQGYVSGRFVNSIDTIQTEGITKEPLLVTSPNSRIISTPALISLNENKDVPEDARFRRNAIPVALLLEGRFPSLFRNRLAASQRDTLRARGQAFQDLSVPGRLIVVADGDIVLNDFLPPESAGAEPQPLPMGWNRYTYTEYLRQSPRSRLFIPAANKEFLLTCVEYLISNPDISATRNKEIVLRLLDGKKVAAQRGNWQLLNCVLPVLLVIGAGWFYQQLRKRKYAA
ncbi:MAG: gliding motility-associated transporter substrate-binding protein GldG [Bacteroidota bacterium]|jgi:gliding-associated putative ABC transporter substrate-binding component GldG